MFQVIEFLAWSDELCIDHDAIDEQHRELITLTNRVHQATLYDHDVWGRRDAFARLRAHTERHFRFEEALLQDIGWADLPAHRAQHDALLDRLYDLEERSLANPRLTMDDTFVELFNGWVTEHIRNADSDLRETFQAARAHAVGAHSSAVNPVLVVTRRSE